MPESIISDELTAFPDETASQEVRYVSSRRQGAFPISERVVS